MNIITGSTGYEHVTPEQDAMWHRGIGADTCVFDVGEKFRPRIMSNNMVRVHDGICSLQGRYMCIDIGSYEDVEIENGTQGLSRIDVICGKITITSGGISSASLEVIKGTAATSPLTPNIPRKDLDDGDLYAYIPLVRVMISGFSITSVSMIGKMYSIGEMPVKRITILPYDWNRDGDYYSTIYTFATVVDENPLTWTPCDSTGLGFPESEQYRYVELVHKDSFGRLVFRATTLPTVTLYFLVKGVQ